MNKLYVILLAAFISISSVGITKAKEPYVYLSVQQKDVNLESLLYCDTITHNALKLTVYSNCFHGPVVACMSSLKNLEGAEILSDRIFIKTDYTGSFISMDRPVIISKPEFGTHDIIIDFKVKANGAYDRAGCYSGTIAFTIMPPAL